MSVRFQPIEVSADARHQRASINKLLDSLGLVSQIKNLERSHLPEIPITDVSALLLPATIARGTPAAGCSRLNVAFLEFARTLMHCFAFERDVHIYHNSTAAGLDAKILASELSQAKNLALLAVSIRDRDETGSAGSEPRLFASSAWNPNPDPWKLI